jgi:hypothetical protein
MLEDGGSSSTPGAPLQSRRNEAVDILVKKAIPRKRNVHVLNTRAMLVARR